MIRTFRATASGEVTAVHDPRSGLTHWAGHTLPEGRVRLDDVKVERWPVIAPADLQRRRPVSVCWSPVVRCNLACPYCLDDKTVQELQQRPRLQAASVLACSGVLGVDISGGEPLLLRDLPLLADVLADGGVAVSITTNGWHLARRADHLARHVDAVRVSLDGPTADQHDTMRAKPGSFTRALDGIRAAREAGLPVQIQTVLMAATACDAQRMVDLAHAAGADGLTFLQFLPIGDAVGQQEAMLTDEQAREIVASLDLPDRPQVRLRERSDAGCFTVIRADGTVYRNSPDAGQIHPMRRLRTPDDLNLDGRDGAA